MKRALDATSVMFGRGPLAAEALKRLTEGDLKSLFTDALTTELPLSLAKELTLAELAVKCGTGRKGESICSRRKMLGMGMYREVHFV